MMTEIFGGADVDVRQTHGKTLPPVSYTRNSPLPRTPAFLLNPIYIHVFVHTLTYSLLLLLSVTVNGQPPFHYLPVSSANFVPFFIYSRVFLARMFSCREWWQNFEFSVSNSILLLNLVKPTFFIFGFLCFCLGCLRNCVGTFRI